MLTLRGYNLVVMLTELHALAGPRIEVSLHGRMKSATVSRSLSTVSTDLHVDTASSALVLADRPILLKGPGAINGWLVGAGALRDLVRAAVARHGALVLGVGGWVVGAEVLDDVVLDEAKSGDTISKCPRQRDMHQQVTSSEATRASFRGGACFGRIL